MRRDQRRRARGVHGQRRAPQAERIGDAAGRHAAGRAQAQVRLEVVRAARETPGVVAVHHAGEHAGAGAVQVSGGDAGPLGQLPRGFQQQPLLRIGGQRLPRRDAEQAGVEVRRVVQEAAALGGRGAGGVWVRVVSDLPASVLGEAGGDIQALGHDAPQVLG
jgi:hypothetical protein